MKYFQNCYKLISKKAITETCFDFIIECKEIADIALTGQFVHVKVSGFSLRRPISICEIDKNAGTIRIVFEIRGEGTEVLSKLSIGDNIDLIGPLGHGFSTDNNKNVLVIGGGIGVPPLLEVCKSYKNATAILGFRSEKQVILEDDFKAIGADLHLCTDDGSKGRKGFVSDELNDILKENKTFDLICACGPKGMLKAIVEIADKYNIPCEVSLEERMGCGIGACLVCACKTVKDGKEFYSHVCKDGPVFNSKEVIL